MRPSHLLSALVALAFAPALSHAAETYTGTARTDFGTESRNGQFELKVNGAKISGRVFSPALSHGFWVHGTLNKAGRFSLQAVNEAVKGHIIGTVRAGKLQGKGHWTSSRENTALVTLKGKMRPPTSQNGNFDYNFSGKTVLTPVDWDEVLYSWAQVTITDGHFTIILAGKGEGDRWDQLDGELRDNRSDRDSAKRIAVIDYEYRIRHTVKDSTARMRAELTLQQDRRSAGNPKIRVVVTTEGWSGISFDGKLPRASTYGNW